MNKRLSLVLVTQHGYTALIDTMVQGTRQQLNFPSFSTQLKTCFLLSDIYYYDIIFELINLTSSLVGIMLSSSGPTSPSWIDVLAIISCI